MFISGQKITSCIQYLEMLPLTASVRLYHGTSIACNPASKHMKNLHTKMLNLHLVDRFMLGNCPEFNKHKVEIIIDQLFGLIVVLLLELGSYVEISTFQLPLSYLELLLNYTFSTFGGVCFRQRWNKIF